MDRPSVPWGELQAIIHSDLWLTILKVTYLEGNQIGNAGFDLKMLKMCKYFHLHASFGCSINIHIKEIPLCFEAEVL